jgi:hypothetical protein
MKSNIKRYALLVATSSLLAVVPAGAANSFYAPGDLVLFFQKEGSTNTVYASLGNTANLYRGTATGTGGQGSLTKTNILDLNTTLESAFGPNWESDTSIYAGLAGVWGTSNTSALLQNQDPHRTLYVSASRNSVGTVGQSSSSPWNLTTAGQTALTNGATGIFSQNNQFENNFDAQQTVALTSLSGIDEANPFLAPGVQGAAMGGLFGGGIQQVGTAGTRGTYDGVGEVEFSLDLYRILSRTSVAGQMGGTLAQGTFEGNIVVGSNGQVSYLVPEPSSLALTGLAAGILAFRRRRSA